MAKRLLKNHPTSIKIDKLTDFMEELGLVLSYGERGFVFFDNDKQDIAVEYRDLEDDNMLYSFPGVFEHKLIIEE